MGSSSRRPLLQLQGMLLFALLLLASIQAEYWQPVADLADLVEKLRDMGGKTLMTELGKKPGLRNFSKGGKTGLKVHKYLCKAVAQGWMDKQNPAGASGTPYFFAVDIPGVDRLPTTFFATIEGGGNSVFTCGSADQLPVQAAGTTLVPSRYPPNDVRITGIRVGQEQVQVPVQTPYVSTAQP